MPPAPSATGPAPSRISSHGRPSRRGVGGAEDHLKAAVAGPLVGVAGRAVAEHRPEDLVTPAEQLLADGRAALLPDPVRCLQVVLQVPAQVLKRVGVEGPGERCLRHFLGNAAVRPRRDLGLAVRAQVHHQPVRQVPTPCRIAGKPAFPITISMLWLTGATGTAFSRDSG